MVRVTPNISSSYDYEYTLKQHLLSLSAALQSKMQAKGTSSNPAARNEDYNSYMLRPGRGAI